MIDKDSTLIKGNLFPYLESFLGTKTSKTLANFEAILQIKRALQLGGIFSRYIVGGGD